MSKHQGFLAKIVPDFFYCRKDLKLAGISILEYHLRDIIYMLFLYRNKFYAIKRLSDLQEFHFCDKHLTVQAKPSYITKSVRVFFN